MATRQGPNIFSMGAEKIEDKERKRQGGLDSNYNNSA